MSLKEVEVEALKLDPGDHADLAHKLLDSLEDLSEKEIEELWIKEAVRRAKELKSGEVVGIPAEEVFAEARARLG